MEQKCLNCENTFKPKLVGTIKEKKYCDEVCRARVAARRMYNKLKNNKDYKEKRKEIFNEWYQKNKQRQNKNVLNDYYRNKRKWKIRDWVRKNRLKILTFINKSCPCGNKEIKFIGHKEFIEYPRLKTGPNDLTRQENLKEIEKYCSDGHLIGFCSRTCLISNLKVKHKI